MRMRPLGKLKVSVVGLGCNSFGGAVSDQADACALIDAALDAGINFFDTANNYNEGRSEEFLGRALGSRRDEVVIATKFGDGDGRALVAGASATAIQESIEGSLRRLGTDHVDLYQLHVPDDSVPIEETLSALDQLIRDGKVLQAGCSNLDARRLDEAARAAYRHNTTRFVSVQNQLSLLRRRGQADMVGACERHDLSILPYYPLTNGLLTGKYRRGERPPRGSRLSGWLADQQGLELSDQKFDLIEKLEAFADQRGHTLLELAMSWLAGEPYVASVIAGATHPAQVRANAAAVGWKLTEDERTLIDEMTTSGDSMAGEETQRRIEELVGVIGVAPLLIDATAGVVDHAISVPPWAVPLSPETWSGLALPDLQPVLEEKLGQDVHLSYSEEPDGVMKVVMRAKRPHDDRLMGLRIFTFPAPEGQETQVAAFFRSS